MDCEGYKWSDDDTGQSVFSPDGQIYARVNNDNGLNIFYFDNESGEFTERERITYPENLFPITSGIAISSNSRYLYTTAKDRVYQYDLNENYVASTQTTVAILDSAQTSEGVRFNKAALAPDGKIYISGRTVHNFLHVIDFPNCKGTYCDVRVNGLALPSSNYFSLPNFPHYRDSSIISSCDTTVSLTSLERKEGALFLYPNPGHNLIAVFAPNISYPNYYLIIDFLGRVRLNGIFEHNDKNEIDITQLKSGIYVISIYSNNFSSSEILQKL